MAKGWYNEPRRHSLARRGVKTAIPKEEIIIKGNRYHTDSFTNLELQKIGERHNLEGKDLQNYILFMQKRFPNHLKDEAYFGEWAGRFRKGTEWAMGDGESRKALIAIDKERYKPLQDTNTLFVYKEGHNAIYPKYSGESGKRSGRVVENRGKTAIVLIDGEAKEIPINELDLSAWQIKRA